MAVPLADMPVNWWSVINTLSAPMNSGDDTHAKLADWQWKQSKAMETKHGNELLR